MYAFIMKAAALVLCLLLIFPLAIFSDDADKEYTAPPEAEQPLLSVELTKPEFVPWGIVGITGAAAGAVVSGIGIFSILDNVENGFNSPGLQTGIIVTVGGGILTAAASLFIEFILQE